MFRFVFGFVFVSVFVCLFVFVFLYYVWGWGGGGGGWWGHPAATDFDSGLLLMLPPLVGELRARQHLRQALRQQNSRRRSSKSGKKTEGLPLRQERNKKSIGGQPNRVIQVGAPSSLKISPHSSIHFFPKSINGCKCKTSKDNPNSIAKSIQILTRSILQPYCGIRSKAPARPGFTHLSMNCIFWGQPKIYQTNILLKVQNIAIMIDDNCQCA